MFFVLKGNKIIKKKVTRISQASLTKTELSFLKALMKTGHITEDDAEDILGLYGQKLVWFINKFQRKTDLYITYKNKEYYLETPISYIY